MSLKSAQLHQVQEEPRLAALSPEASFLAVVSRHVQRTQTMDELLAGLFPLLAAAADTEWMLMMELKQARLVLRAAFGDIPGAILELAHEGVTQGLCWHAALENCAIFTPRYSDEPRRVGGVAASFHGACAFLPLPDSTGNAHRVLVLASTEARREWPTTTQVALEVAAGMIGTALALHSEIEERERRGRDLQEIGERFHALFNQAAVGMALVGLKGHFLEVNQRLADMLGYSCQDLERKTFAEITHGDDREIDLENLRRIQTGELPHFTREKRYLHRNGDTIWIHLTATAVSDPQGQPRCVLSVMEDITARKSAEQELRQLNAKLEHRIIERTSELEKLVDTAVRRAADQTYLTNLTRELERQDDPSVLMERVGERLLARIDAHLVVCLVGTVEDGLDVWSQSGEMPEPARDRLRERLTSQASAAFWASLKSGTPRYVDDLTQPELAAQLTLPLRRAELASAAHLPFSAPDGRIAVLAAMRFGAPAAWTAEQRILLEATVQTLNLSFQRACRMKELEESRRYADAMVAILKYTDSELSLEDMARGVAEVIGQSADVDLATLSIVEGDVCFIHTVCSSAKLDPRLEQLLTESRSRGVGVVWTVLEQDQALYVDDYAARKQAVPELVALGARSIAMVPLNTSLRGRPMVFSAVRLGRMRPWSHRDRTLFEAAARTIRIARERRELAERRLEQVQARSLELEADNRRFQEMSKLKSEFLANMSHELRTPLNSIIGFAELIFDEKVGPAEPEYKECLSDILSSSRHLLQLINDVLDLSKVEAGKIQFRPLASNVLSLIEEVLGTLRSHMTTKGIHVEAQVDPTLIAVDLDPDRFRQVLYNYLSNALKFTPYGGRVTVRALAEKDPGAFRLEVEDTGIGIAADEIGKLFVEFQQLDEGRSKRHSGTGLGLAITKKLIEAQNGQVGVISTPGRGSTFYAVIPRQLGVR